jgi:predicted transcriptional regulator
MMDCRFRMKSAAGRADCDFFRADWRCVREMTAYDNVIMRTIIELPDDQVAALSELCEAEKISRAEAIRRALAEMLSRKQATNREQAFGAWAQRGDSRKYVEGLREEWEK